MTESNIIIYHLWVKKSMCLIRNVNRNMNLPPPPPAFCRCQGFQNMLLGSDHSPVTSSWSRKALWTGTRGWVGRVPPA